MFSIPKPTDPRFPTNGPPTTGPLGPHPSTNPANQPSDVNPTTGLPWGMTSPPFQGGMHNGPNPPPPFQGGIHNAPKPPGFPGTAPHQISGTSSQDHQPDNPAPQSKQQHRPSAGSQAETIASLHNFRFPGVDDSNSTAVPPPQQQNQQQNRGPPPSRNNSNNRHIELPPLSQAQSLASTTKRASKTPSPSAKSYSARSSSKRSRKGKKTRQKVKRIAKRGCARLRGIASALRKRLSKGKK
ncbi:hypothetical protein QBC43DRAFT_329441 [Cladorrhinum sp. PSN259]|nr:hypothetical protein QBC43DRAFT_329441 [Cladorrhinum sp. PSN259]